MSTRLSQHFEKARIAKGLKPGQLAQIAGCQNIPKNGGRIRAFELTGKIGQELFGKVAVVLEIDEATIVKLVEEDRREFFEKWLVWVSEPIKPYLVVRLIAAFYSNLPVPPEITTMEEAEQWASAVAKQRGLRCCLVWSRRISCWIDEQGNVYSKTEAVPGEVNEPWMRIGGKTFTLAPDLRSASQVNWPKR